MNRSHCHLKQHLDSFSFWSFNLLHNERKKSLKKWKNRQFWQIFCSVSNRNTDILELACRFQGELVQIDVLAQKWNPHSPWISHHMVEQRKSWTKSQPVWQNNTLFFFYIHVYPAWEIWTTSMNINPLQPWTWLNLVRDTSYHWLIGLMGLPSGFHSFHSTCWLSQRPGSGSRRIQ